MNWAPGTPGPHALRNLAPGDGFIGPKPQAVPQPSFAFISPPTGPVPLAGRTVPGVNYKSAPRDPDDEWDSGPVVLPFEGCPSPMLVSGPDRNGSGIPDYLEKWMWNTPGGIVAAGVSMKESVFY